MQTRRMANLHNSSMIRGVKDIKSMSSLLLTPEEREHLFSIVDQKAMSENEFREKARFARQDAAKRKYQKTYYKARDRLAAIINKNRRITELRLELQYNRAAENNFNIIKKSSDNLRKD